MAALPVINLAEFSNQNHTKNILEASRYWGCFRVINHGIPGCLQSKMKAAVKSLFDLPDDVKRRNVSDIVDASYRCRPPLYEAFGLYDASSQTDVDAFCSLLDAPIHARGTIKTYAQKSHEVMVDIATKLAESMGLKDQNFSEWQFIFRLIKYNFNQDSVGSNSGVQTHSDAGFLTLLQEDECVGGLEILDPGSDSYVEVDPLPGSLLVLLGDVAKVWSNGVFRNVKHRVECKAAIPRFTIALFMWAPKDDKVTVPAALVDSDHPRMYRSFIFNEYRKLRLSAGFRAGEALSQLLV